MRRDYHDGPRSQIASFSVSANYLLDRPHAFPKMPATHSDEIEWRSLLNVAQCLRRKILVVAHRGICDCQIIANHRDSHHRRCTVGVRKLRKTEEFRMGTHSSILLLLSLELMIGTIEQKVDADRRMLDEMVSTPKARASPLRPFVARVYFDISAA